MLSEEGLPLVQFYGLLDLLLHLATQYKAEENSLSECKSCFLNVKWFLKIISRNVNWIGGAKMSFGQRCRGELCMGGGGEGVGGRSG